ncbi:uncharacterized protein GGS22DRAFT_189111 [Annulohypoxylon maeteangense]|uniref:uncharacterized protein n=1 Tax=Annulohypoxylon maeteangense TaxID=1927788 RepID=UPI0020082E23|nr:uncharacterized protein GGS22DRAFT_189111 [Annulohypoxylon maeteangense]KAI0884898.1 hypothetical protein GGS22DRAFT_189111 [Annulohypoxylon maeteangense]
MRFITIARTVLAASAVLAVGGAVSQAAPISPFSTANNTEGSASVSALSYNETVDEGNVTVYKGIDGLPWLSHITCKRNFFNEKQLTPEERERMLGCYKDFQDKGQWVGQMTKCNDTKRYFQSWGHHWDSPPDCWNACKGCFEDAVFDQAANFRCWKYEGFSARCHVTYE